MRIRLFLAPIVLAVFTACAPTSGPAFYLLNSDPQAASIVTGEAIGLREIALPLYARRAQIAVLAPSGEISLSEDHRWAEEPPRAASRHIARDIAAKLKRPVVVEPWPEGVRPTIRVDIEVDVFVGSLGQTVRLTGQYRVVRSTGADPVSVVQFDLTAPLANESFGALVDGHSNALSTLADLIVQDLSR